MDDLIFYLRYLVVSPITKLAKTNETIAWKKQNSFQLQYTTLFYHKKDWQTN